MQKDQYEVKAMNATMSAGAEWKPSSLLSHVEASKKDERARQSNWSSETNKKKKTMDSRESKSLEDHLIGLGLTNHNVLLSLSTNQYLSVIWLANHTELWLANLDWPIREEGHAWGPRAQQMSVRSLINRTLFSTYFWTIFVKFGVCEGLGDKAYSTEVRENT